MTSCCHPFTGACEQGHDCPVRETPCPAQAFYDQHKLFLDELGPLPAPVDDSSTPLPVLHDPTLRPLLLAVFTAGAAFGGAAVQLWSLA